MATSISKSVKPCREDLGRARFIRKEKRLRASPTTHQAFERIMFTFHNRPRQMRATRNTSESNRDCRRIWGMLASQRIRAIRAVRNQRFHCTQHVVKFFQTYPFTSHFAIEEVPTAKERRCSNEKNRECHAKFGQSKAMTRVYHKRLRENTTLRVSIQNGKSA